MKLARLITLFTISALSLPALEKGDTYDQVVAELGKPTSQLEVNGLQVLNYPGQRIKLKDKVVVSVSVPPPAPPPSTVVPAPKPAPKPRPAPPARAEPSRAELNWTTDYVQALSDAKSSGAKVFLFFTGSDWCGWCMRLDGEILATEAFKAYADRNLILVKLDFPRRAALSEELKTQNEQLARKHRVTGFPTVVVLNSQGKRVGRLGYQEGGPGPFVAALEKL